MYLRVRNEITTFFILVYTSAFSCHYWIKDHIDRLPGLTAISGIRAVSWPRYSIQVQILSHFSK